MPIINKIFNGKLNVDDNEYRIPEGDYIDALNISKDAEGEEQDEVRSNIVGNVNVPYALASGENKIIGGYPDKIRNRYYYFLWNSNGYHAIMYYDANTDSVIKLLESITDSNGIDILNFNPSYKIFSVNIIYRDLSEGDLVFFNDAYNEPRVINTNANFFQSWKAEYLSVAKAPPIMPPKCVYENDTTVNINNLRNALFQFRYRFVYDNNEKSVWGSAGIVPLPNQTSLQLTDNTYTNNARISLTVSTGNAQVSKIEIAFRQVKDGTTSDWFLLTSLDKASLTIADDSVYTYRFYNEGIYSAVDILDIVELQDYVPIRANAGELVNGSNLVYGGILEGYDTLKTDISVITSLNTDNFFYDYNGLLFFAETNGLDSGATGTFLKIYVYGTGTNNGQGVVQTLNNGAAYYVINTVNNLGVNIGATILNTTDSISVNTLLTNVSTALQANGWTQYNLSANELIMQYTAGFTLYSSGTKLYSNSSNNNTTSFAMPFKAGGEVAIQYFDSKGRTNGALNNVGALFTTPSSDTINFCQPTVYIRHRPPEWAISYQLLRINNSTYLKRLFWISNSAYSSPSVAPPGYRYAYIGISNIQEYNDQISATSGIVSYTFQQGDRIRFLKRYDVTNTPIILTQFDYEVIGTETDIKIDGVIREGTFVKIFYPSNDISGSFNFDGTENFLHYEVLLYNYKQHAIGAGNVFYEFGKSFGIGNPGTSNAFHIGLDQTQSANLVTPAIISIANGDLFWRKRTIPFGDSYSFDAGGQTQDISTNLVITVPTTIDNTVYKLQSEVYAVNATLDPGAYPTWANTDQFFWNKSTNPSNSISLKIKADYSVVQFASGLTNYSMYAVICTNLVPFAAKYRISLLEPEINVVNSNTTTTFTVDTTISVPPTGKVWIAVVPDNPGIGETFLVNAFKLNVTVEKSATISIIEDSFSDVYNLVTNSNGRPSVIDENAKQTYFPTLVRFSQSYQQDTNINGTNRFYAANFDTYDRSFGDIMRLHVRDRYMKVYQKFKVGNVPVLTQIVKDVTGNPLQANTDQLINKIQYYAGDYGIGDSPTSLAWNNFADYFVDDYRGVVCRLSQNGITPLSILYKTNAFFVPALKNFRQDLNNGIAPAGQVYKGNPCIYGAFNAYTNKYIVALEEINRYSDPNTLKFHQDAYTMPFAENDNAFEGFYSYAPEWIDCLNTLLVSFKYGNFWRHNNTVHCNFYGIQYGCSITVVFNSASLDKKTWLSVMETANQIWECPVIYSQLNTYGSQPQESYLLPDNFTLLEGEYHSPFMRDINSPGGWINGWELKGNYLVVKFEVKNAANFVYLNSATVKYINSPLNSR